MRCLVKEFEGGMYRFFYGDLDNLASKKNLVFNESFDRHIYEHPTCHIGKGDVVVDGGTHVGVFTTYALIRGAGRVICVEPNPTNFYNVQRTVRENFPNLNSEVLFVNKALWNENHCRLRFNTSLEGTGSARVVPRGKRHQAAALSITLDTLLLESEVSWVDYIKLDIEGSELNALKGMTETVRRCHPKLAVCLYHKPEDVNEIPQFIRDNFPGYNLVTTDNGKVGIWS